MRRRALVAGGVAGVLVVIGLGVVPLIRARVADLAARQHAEIDVGSVGVGWFSVTLSDVRVRPNGVSAEVRIRSLRARVGALLHVSSAEIHGVEADSAASCSSMLEQLADWRRSATPSTPASGSRSPAPVDADGISIRCGSASDGARELEVTGASAARGADGALRMAFEAASLRRGGVDVGVDRASAELDPGGALRSARVTSLSIAWRRSAGASAVAAPVANEPLPPALPLGPGAPPVDAHALERLPLPDLPRARALLAAAKDVARSRIAADARIDVSSLGFAQVEANHRLAIGHGPLTLHRSADAIDLAFTTGQTSDGTPVSLTARLPLDGGDTTLVLAGGPVSLGALGIDDGAAGLTEVDRTSVTARGRIALPSAADALTFDGEISTHALALREARLADEVVRGIDADVLVRGALDTSGGLRLDDAELTFGALHASAHGHAEQGEDHLAADLAFEVPTTSCQRLLQSIPSALVTTLDGSEASGTLGARGRVAFDSRKLDDLVFDVAVQDRCAATVVPAGLAKERFSEPFEHTIYAPDGTIEEETTGPTTDNWTDLAHISPFMQVAVLTTEDGAFYKHHGFNRAAMRNALVADLKAGKFVRGASTITMQLAKNLFLSREKTVARKLEEIILADYLEGTFAKKEMMELYLNVIEFGPNVYGITQAAAHYFGRKPDELNLAECLFLSSILPSPVRYHKLAEKPELSEAWTKHLRDLMKIAARLGTISDAELAAGLEEQVAFRSPKDPLPPPRPSVTGTHFQSLLADMDAAADAPPP